MKQRDIPKLVWIKGNPWSVKFVRKIPKYPNDTGQCDPSERIIYIRQGLSYIERGTTYYHEKLHAFEAEYNFKLNHRQLELVAKCFANLLLENI